MMKNSTGLFDMALALSVNKINSQFAKMLSDKVLPNKLTFLTDKNGKVVFNDQEAFVSEREKWQKALSAETPEQIQKLKTDIKSEKGKSKPDKAKLDKLREQLEELTDLQDAAGEYAKYDCALDAVVNGYEVEIADDSNHLIFTINLKSATLHTKEYDAALKAEKIVEAEFLDEPSDESSDEDSLDDLYKPSAFRYAFLVSISERIIKAKEMQLDDEDKDKLITEADGIPDDIFRIEALFMDFQNSNISNYDGKKSRFPKDFDTAWLQVLMTNYFKSLKQNRNPFILGYKIEPIKKLPPSLFQPTGVMYSTTASKETRSQAFNFLMQTENRSFPKDLKRGIFSKSLIESVVDKTETVNGVYAINYPVFIEKYVYQTLLPVIMKKFEDNLKSYDVKTDGGNGLRCSKDKTQFNLIFENNSISTIPYSRNEAQGLEISWDISMRGEHEYEDTIMYFPADKIISFSTEGTHKLNDKTGEKGKVTLVLTAGDKGKLELQATQINSPQLGMDSAKPRNKNPYNDIAEGVLDASALIAIFKLLNGTLFNEKKYSFDNSDMSRFELGSFEGFSNRIILPGNNTFTFKTVRLSDENKNDDTAVIFDIAYVPEND